MKFRINNVDKEDVFKSKVSERYKDILKKYKYNEDDKYSYIEIDSLDSMISLEKELTSKNGFGRGIIIEETTIIIYDDYIE